MLDQPIDCADKVQIVYPGNILPTASGCTTKSETYEPEHRIEDPSTVRAHDHRGPHQNFSGSRRIGFICHTFPRSSDIDTKIPRLWRAWLVSRSEERRVGKE